MKIKVKEIIPGCFPTELKKGEWFDLKSAVNTTLLGPKANTLKRIRKKDEEEINYRNVEFQSALISLGIAMQLPEGYEAIICPRSSTYCTYGVIMSNHMGIIDNSYCGDGDIWKMPVIAFKSTTIPKGARICQFRIQLSQKATMWQKIKWLFTRKIKFIPVNKLNSINREGFGSTGK